MSLRRAVLRALPLLLILQPAPSVAAPPDAEPGSRSAALRLDAELPRRCGVCHLDKVPAAAPGLMVFAPPPQSAAAGDAGMCYSCHNGIVLDGRRSRWSGRHHPSSGNVSCGSCHTPHVRVANVGPFMRYPRGSYSFCANCHAGRRGGQPGEHPGVSPEDRPRDCGACHLVHGAAAEGLLAAASAERLCGECHGENPSRAGRGPGKTTHKIGKDGAPACLDCHRVHRAAARGLLDRAALDGRLCQRCHAGQFSSSRGEPNHPVSTEQSGCLACHRMHNVERPGARRGLLAAPWTEADSICRRCHAGLEGPGPGGSWNHPVGKLLPPDDRKFSGRLVRAGAMLAQGGKVLCLSCHRPHGGLVGTPQLVAPRETLCLHCHAAQNSLDPARAALGTHPVSVLPRRARINTAFLNAGGTTDASGRLTCATCHRAHNARPGTHGLVIPLDSYSCLLCHSREASISSTIHGTARAPGTKVGPENAGLCRGCHGEHGWRVPLAAPVEGQTTIERVCAGCHVGDADEEGVAWTSNHPLALGLTLGRGSAGLPLFWADGRRYRRGMITCATCHDVHRGGVRGQFLRTVGGGSDLCGGCHPEQAVVAGTRHDLKPGQGSTCSPCHPVHKTVGPAAWPATAGIPGGGNSDGDAGGGDGEESAKQADFCGGCHSAAGRAAGAVVAERTHPSGSGSATENAKRVGCRGCHDPHRWNPADLADRGADVPGDASTMFLIRPANGRGALCAECHAAKSTVSGTAHDLTGRAERGLPAGVPDPRRHGVCAPCHRIHGEPKFPQAPATSKKQTGGSAGGSDRCESCHAAGRLAAAALAGERGHPIGVSPGKGLALDLPLYGPDGRRQADGKLACATCHDPHSWTPPGGSGAPSKAASSFLRLGADGFAPLCFPCHAEKSLVVGTDHDLRVTAPEVLNPAGETAEQSGVCGVCHAVHRAPPGRALWRRGYGDGHDERSRACGACHQPGNEKGATLPPRPEPHLVNYPGRGLEVRKFEITRALASGPMVLQLFDEGGARSERGRLSCASCHDVHRWSRDGNDAREGVPVEGNVKSSFLRVREEDLPRTLCVECHAATLLEHFRDYHFPEPR